MKLFDSHCHVNFNAFKADSDEAIHRCLDNGIYINVVGSQSTTSKRAVEYAEKYPQGVYATAGLHPIHLFQQEIDEEEDHFATRAEEFDYELYKKLASHEKVIAIGEMGFDYFHLPTGNIKTQEHKNIKTMQKETFVQGLRLAAELNKPIVIHTRASKGTFDAYDDVLAVLSDVKSQMSNVHGVLHCFGGTLEQARKFIDLGFYIGITGIVTFKNAPEIHELAREIPLDKILVETDAPYLAPVPYRGQRNEPAYVQHVAKKIAELRNTTFEKVTEQTTENARELFKLSSF